MTTSFSPTIPILLLKTKSTPTDSYESQFSSTSSELTFSPTFIPVLEHTLLDDGLSTVHSLLKKKEIGIGKNKKYGGMIFTSQRAVEAFAFLISQAHQNGDERFPNLLPPTPLYTVGPATSHALSSLPTSPPLSNQIHGSETGNGLALSHFILNHYPTIHPNTVPLPPLLFLVGEQRRDIIPKTLDDVKLGKEERIRVDEVVVYGTCEKGSFESDFREVLRETESGDEGNGVRWVVVFSPSGCEGMLRVLGLLGKNTSQAQDGEREGKGKMRTYIATIGPTTRDFLKEKFGFEADVCAETPSPEGVRRGVEGFMREKRLL